MFLPLLSLCYTYWSCVFKLHAFLKFLYAPPPLVILILMGKIASVSVDLSCFIYETERLP